MFRAHIYTHQGCIYMAKYTRLPNSYKSSQTVPFQWSPGAGDKAAAISFHPQIFTACLYVNRPVLGTTVTFKMQRSYLHNLEPQGSKPKQIKNLNGKSNACCGLLLLCTYLIMI